MSKYNDFMSHIRVDDEMHRRVMTAVSRAINERDTDKDTGVMAIPSAAPDKSDTEEKVKESPRRVKAKVSPIKIMSIAAACILVAGGALFIATRFFSKSGSTTLMNVYKNADEASYDETVVNEEVNQVAGAQGIKSNPKKSADVASRNKTAAPEVRGDQDNKEESVDGAGTSAASAPTEAEESAESEAGGDKKTFGLAPQGKASAGKSGIEGLLPFKVKTVGSTAYGSRNITAKVYTGENGEKMVFFTAKEGTDLVKLYYPRFRGIPALLQTESGQQFEAVDTSAGRREQVGAEGPFDAVTWTKNGTSYMVVFNTKTDVTVFISIMEQI